MVESGEKRFAIEVKWSSEGRKDRLIPLLAQAILEARASARQPAEELVPVAVVGAPRISQSVARQLKEFAHRYAPEVGAGVLDKQGLRAFSGYGLDCLDARPSRSALRTAASLQRLPYLFSDLNQWMLKILLGQSLPEDFLSAPRRPLRSATELAKAARVSLMSASRFVRQLGNEGFLDDGHDFLRIVRVDELMARWAAAERHSASDIPVRWIIQRGPTQLGETLKDCHSSARGRPRCALGLFAAAEALGLGMVQGAPPHIYLERAERASLQQLGLSTENASHKADAYVRVPENPEAVFRAAVTRKGVPVCDVLQVWLDVSGHPARGPEQADEIRRRVLGPLLGRR